MTDKENAAASLVILSDGLAANYYQHEGSTYCNFHFFFFGRPRNAQDSKSALRQAVKGLHELERKVVDGELPTPDFLVGETETRLLLNQVRRLEKSYRGRATIRTEDNRFSIDLSEAKTKQEKRVLLHEITQGLAGVMNEQLQRAERLIS